MLILGENYFLFALFFCKLKLYMSSVKGVKAELVGNAFDNEISFRIKKIREEWLTRSCNLFLITSQKKTRTLTNSVNDNVNRLSTRLIFNKAKMYSNEVQDLIVIIAPNPNADGSSSKEF